MCGIYALVSKIRNIMDCTKTYKQFMQIKYRGPDSTKCIHIGDVSLGFHRLAIIDPTEKSNQPFFEDGIYLICNGEIYNYKELIYDHDLKLSTKSDCEVILHLFKIYGIRKTCQLLDGEFCFIIYDSNNKMLYAARDIYGVRPMFYSTNELCIASEAKAIDNLNTLPFKPNTYMHYDLSLDTIKFYSYYAHPTIDMSITYNMTMETVKKLFTKAVNKRLMSDRPLGTLLSGGLDSSLVTAICHKYNPDITCFSVGLEGSVDIHYARKVAEFLNIKNHHIITFTIEEGFNLIEEVIKTLETYDVTTIRASVPQYIMSKYIKENTNIRVLLSGEGSDEIGGYLYFKNAPNSKEFHEDCLRLLSELYMFDNLRTDRTMASCGLEVRVPFLDKEYLDFYLGTNPEYRMIKVNQMEKQLLRDSFKMDNLLPYEVLYRRKEAFSDAVSSKDTSWYREVQKKINNLISDDEFKNTKYADNNSMTKEGLYYRKIYETYYPNQKLITHYWMPKWQEDNLTDPSATVLKVY